MMKKNRKNGIILNINSEQKGKYKAVFSDIDGTLLNSEHQISPDTRKKILELVGRDIPFVLVSARMPDGMEFIRKELGCRCPMICYSGALVLDEKGDSIYSVYLRGEDVKKIDDYIKENEPEISMNLYSKNQWIVENAEDFWVRQESDITGTLPLVKSFQKENVREKANKILCMGEPEKIARLEEGLKKQVPGIHIYRSKPTYLEIGSGEASKSGAVQMLEKYFGIRREEILAFGDGYNDIDMLEYAGLGVAMGNADRQVQQRSDYVTADNDEEGVLKVLDQLF